MSPRGYQQQNEKVENSIGQMSWFLHQINVEREREREECGYHYRSRKYICPFVLDSDSNKPSLKKIGEIFYFDDINKLMSIFYGIMVSQLWFFFRIHIS